VIRTFRYPLKPNETQRHALERWRVACCDLYNGALQHRRDAWDRQKSRVRLYDQQKELTALRTADQRQHECSCGFSAHRDHNAALVILGRGLRPAQLAEAFDGIAVHQRDAAVCP